MTATNFCQTHDDCKKNPELSRSCYKQVRVPHAWVEVIDESVGESVYECASCGIDGGIVVYEHTPRPRYAGGFSLPDDCVLTSGILRGVHIGRLETWLVGGSPLVRVVFNVLIGYRSENDTDLEQAFTEARCPTNLKALSDVVTRLTTDDGGRNAGERDSEELARDVRDALLQAGFSGKDIYDAYVCAYMAYMHANAVGHVFEELREHPRPRAARSRTP